MQDNRFSDGGDWEQQKHSNEQINKYPVFFFWNKNTEIQWLRDFLSKTSITGASICYISHPPDWKTLAWKSSPIILCHSFSTNTEWTCLEEFLTHSNGLPGKRVIVIITDVKDRGSEKSIQEEWGKWKFPGFELITLTCEEIDSISTYISQDLSPERKMARKIHILKNILQTTAVEKDKIGIFSRSDSSEYTWLVKLLTSTNFSGWVLSATPYYIANYQFEKFKNDVSQCTFGILYHTKNSGRINVTNVTSSLYDEELKHLHEKLGRDNVIVVIDDLEKSTDRVKNQILKEQHSIKKWARDLFIFCQEEKKTDPHIIPSMEEKMKHLEAMITDSTGYFLASTGSTGQCVASLTRQRTPAFPGSSRQNVRASASLTGQGPSASKVFTAPRSFFLNNSSTSQAQSRESDSTGCFPASTSSTRQRTPAFPGSSRQTVPASASLTGQRPFASNVSTAHSSFFPNNSSTSQAQSMESGFNLGKEQSTEKNRKSITKRVHTVGIFSITEDTEYNWLKSLLGKKFRSVKSFYISFSRFHQFQDGLSQCTHGILYHTKNRGRINVTDVTDSLYDKHLKHMSDTLGKNRVIVVLDDLDDNSDKMRKTILQEQPKIRQLARDLFLVRKGTDRQKMCYFEHNRKPDFS
ncbi:uncharacterized protein [Aquarana catesbeiana]|uniref:uncharacterized protein isoform X2 n=1 Tax=Aquarana catesbeiana TaxID=8400 RepID=UPI003CC934EA